MCMLAVYSNITLKIKTTDDKYIQFHINIYYYLLSTQHKPSIAISPASPFCIVCILKHWLLKVYLTTGMYV